MSAQSRSALKSTNQTNFADNTTGLITPLITRNFYNDLIDSFVNNTDDVGLFSTETSIVTADVLTAYATPVELVPAPGAGKIIMPKHVLIQMDYNSAAYATNTTLVIGLDGATAGTLIPLGTQASIINQTTDMTSWIYFTSGSAASLTTMVNKNLCFAVQTGNPTAGNSGLVVYVTYIVITL